MAGLDVFKADAFSMQSMTAAIEKLPYVPSRVGKMGLFRSVPITTMVATVEERLGKLALIPARVRGVETTAAPRDNVKVRNFSVPHLPLNDQVLAADVAGMRAFGTESELETVASVVNQRLTALRQHHEITHEYHRIGALRGTILDADATTVLVNLFTEFDITESNVNFHFTNDDVKTKALTIIRLIEDALGNAPYDHIHALCSDTFFDALVASATVKPAYENYEKGSQFLINQQREGFSFGGIIWENYRGKVGGSDFIPAGTARFFPVGAPDIFQAIYSPANFIETVNTPGKPIYVKQEPLPMDIGVKIHTQSNPLMMCTRPAVLVKGTKTGP